MARTHPIDVDLVDLKMPGIDGEKTLEVLKKEHKWLKVVILTGHGSIDSALLCSKHGAYYYLQKPCSLEELLEVLSEAYKEKVMNMMQLRQEQVEELLDMSHSESPLTILRRLKELDEGHRKT
jgi:DNA-binding NtrC family response regulator